MTTSIEQILSEFDSKFDYLNARHTNEQWDEYKDFLTSKLTEYGQDEYKRGREDVVDYIELNYRPFGRGDAPNLAKVLEAARKGA